ncbi:MAG: hypothetical protein Q9165_008771 [Trypethelium subeluteriae]
MEKLDHSTVKSLELTAPGACKVEKDNLYQKLQLGKIFGAFSPSEREKIWKEVLLRSTIRLIPTFHSFFEDVKYLQGPAKCVRALIDEEEVETLSSAMTEMYPTNDREQNRCIIQTAASEFVCVDSDALNRFDLARRQVWISAMRDYREMPIQRLDDNLLALPTLERNESVVFRFALLAHRLGLKSKIISDLIANSPGQNIVNNGPDKQQSGIRVTEPTLRPPRRCGIPNTGDYKADKASLFLDTLHNIRDEHEITSLFIRRSVYFHFFVEADESGIDRETTHIPIEHGQAQEEPQVTNNNQQQNSVGAVQASKDIENRKMEIEGHDKELQEREKLLQLREKQLTDRQQRIETEHNAQNKLLEETQEMLAAAREREKKLLEHAEAEFAAVQERKEELSERVKKLEEQRKEMQVQVQTAEQLKAIQGSQEQFLGERQERIIVQENKLQGLEKELEKREKEVTQREYDLRVQESHKAHVQSPTNKDEHRKRELVDTLYNQMNQDEEEDMRTVSPLESPPEQSEKIGNATHAIDTLNNQTVEDEGENIETVSPFDSPIEQPETNEDARAVDAIILNNPSSDNSITEE